MTDPQPTPPNSGNATRYLPYESALLLFEHHMQGLVRQKKLQPCHFGRMIVNGVFSHYVEPDTDTLRLGFIAGMNCMLQAISETYTNAHKNEVLCNLKDKADKLAPQANDIEPQLTESEPA